MELRVFVEPQMGATYEQQATMARTAEACGFGAFFRSDHFLTMGGSGLPGPTDSWVTLGAIAKETSTIRLGTLLTSATFRHPGLLAIEVAQVDAMSGGRVELGLGAGWYEEEHRAYGVPFYGLGERFERLAEQLEIVTGLWATPKGERFSFSGRHYQLADSPALPKPHQSPHPPVIVGGYGARRTPRLAARHAAEFNLPFGDVATTAAQYERVKAACEQVGRDPATLVLSVAVVACCATSSAELARRAGRIGREVDELRAHGAAGRPADVVETLARYGEIGATRAYLQLLDLDDLDHVRLLGEEVLPALR